MASFIIDCGFKPNMTHLCPIFRLGNIANGKLRFFFINLNQSKHHCYTLSTTCTLFKLAVEVGPRTNNLHIQIFTSH